MAEHPIQGLMDTAMSNIKSMIDVNTIVGDPVTTPDGTVIIPISTVGFGFGAGGSEFAGTKKSAGNEEKAPMFGGGCGGGANVKPVAFMVVGNGTVKLMPVNPNSSADKLVSLIPEVFDKVNDVVMSVSEKISKKKKEKKEKAEDIKVEVSEPVK